jgi:hypothetical protein
MTQPPLLYSAVMLGVGVMFLHVAAGAIRTGFHGMRGGAAYRDRHPIRFWSYVALDIIFGAGALVLGAFWLGWWAWKQFSHAALP